MASYEDSPHPDEGKIVKTKIMVGGEWHKVNKLMDYMINQGPAVGEKFSKLSKREQADVLKGRATLENVQTVLPPECPRRDWYGNGGKGGCDGCGMMRIKVDDAAPDLALTVCPRCQYAVCDECRIDERAEPVVADVGELVAQNERGCCYCEDSNMGVAYPEVRAAHHRGFW